MDEKKNTENGEYQFIRERIISRKKDRVKKVLIIIGGTVLLAVLFGFLARLSFTYSEEPVRKILGFTPTPSATVTPTRSAIWIPTSQERPTPTNTPIPTPTPTATPTPVVTLKPTNKPETSPTEKPEISPTKEPTATPTVTATPTATLTPTPTEVPDDISKLMDLYEKIGEIADESMKYMAEISLVKIETDWFGENLEQSESVSGIIVGDNGVELLVVLDASLALSADRIDIKIGTGTVNGVNVMASNDEYNLAVLSVPLDKIKKDDRETIEYAVFGESSSVKAGTPVIAIGSPNGYMGAYGLTMIMTISDHAYLTDNRISLYNTYMPENELGSGVYVNMDGEVIGLVTHSFKNEKNATLSTMIAIDSVRDIIENMVNGIPWNYVGIVATETPEGVLEKLGKKYGLYVTEVKEGSPAEEAGLKKGDILISVNGRELKTVDTFHSIIQECEPGDIAVFELIRSSKVTTVNVDIGETK